MEITEFDREFVERTKDIIETIPDNYKYEVTLLINCLQGLVSLPTEKTNNQNRFFQAKCWQKLRSMENVIQKETDEKKTFRALKNALSHVYIEPINKNQKIQKVIFRDKKRSKRGNAEEFHTELSFSVAQLKEYALFVANLHLQQYKD